MKSVKKEEDITFDSDIITAALQKTPKRKQSIKFEIKSCKVDKDDGDNDEEDKEEQEEEEEDTQEVVPPPKVRKAPKREAQQSAKVEN